MALPNRSKAPRVLALVAVLAVALTVADSATAGPPIDRERATVSFAVARRNWIESGLDKLPSDYSPDRFQKAVNGEDDPYNIVAAIAVATLHANPGREDAVQRYLNEALLPYALAHKAQYLCLVAEVFYNSTARTDELKGLATKGQSSDTWGIAFIDYAFFLIKTEPDRKKLKLVAPADNGVPEAVGAFEKTLTPTGGALVPESAVKLDCDHQS